MLLNFIASLFGQQQDKLRRYTTISPDGHLIVLCYHRLAELMNNGTCCIASQEDVSSTQ